MASSRLLQRVGLKHGQQNLLHRTTRALCDGSRDSGGMLVSQRRMRAERQRAFLQRLPTPESCTLSPIGVVRSPYTLRYDCPRQPTAAPGLGSTRPEPATATIQLHGGMGLEDSVRDLAGFDYIWLLYLFHANESWKPLVTLPPDPEAPDGNDGSDGCLGARALRRPSHRVGVLSSRAPHRPNPLGLSALRLVHADAKGLKLHVQGIDCLDGTPVLDIKPYIPYADAFPHARASWPDGGGKGSRGVAVGAVPTREAKE